LKIETTPQEDHQINIVAEFEADVFENYKRRAARKIAAKTKIAGFRPGKAPYEIVLRYVGEGAISEEAIELLVDDQYAEVLKEAAIEPSGPGALKEIISLSPPKLSFIVPLQPEVDLGDYKNVRLDYAPPAVEPEEVAEFFKRMQRNYASAEPTNEPSKNGDLIYVQITALDKSKPEGENSIFTDRPIQLILGDELNKNEWPFQDFSKELLDMTEGSEKTIVHKFPEEFEDTELSGKNVDFQIKVQSVKTLVLPELNDEFAKTLGQFETYADLEKSVKEQLESTKNQDYDDQYYTDLLAKLAEQATVKYPTFMVNEEIEHILSSVKNDLSRQNLDFETYLKIMKTDEKKYVEENVQPAAEKRLRNSLIIDKFAQLEKIQIGQSDVESIMNETSQMMTEMNPEGKGKKGKFTKQQMNSAAYNAVSRLYNQRTLERMRDIASGKLDVVAGTDEPVVAEEPIKAEKPKSRKKKVSSVKSDEESAPAQE
jgi:trigger factor